MSTIKVKQLEPEDDEITEEWTRVTDTPHLLGTGAHKWEGDGDWPWTVTVRVAEYYRSEPLESELNAAIGEALESVEGVEKAAHEDRGRWVIQGEPDGKALVIAVAKVLDQFVDRTRAEYEAGNH